MKYIYHNCVVFLLMAALCSCEQKVVNPQNESTPSEWEALNIDDYEIDQRVNCFCATPPANRFHKITVRDDKIVSAVDLQDGQVLPEKDFAFFKTISELVEFVDSTFRMDLSTETLSRTSFKNAKQGDRLNLERSLTPSSKAVDCRLDDFYGSQFHDPAYRTAQQQRRLWLRR